jgi:hypothetical protein
MAVDDSSKPLRFTTQMAIFIFVGIITASIIFSFIFGSYNDFENNRLRIFMTSLTALGTIAVLFFYYGVIQLNQTQQRQAVINQTLDFGNLINSDINQYMIDYINDIPDFIKSINPLSVCNEKDFVVEDTYANCIRKQVLSKNIFNIWNNTVLIIPFLDYDSVSYISTFLQWANSTQLHEIWDKYKYNYITETMEFGDLLFKYGLPIKDLTPEGFKHASEELIKDPLFQDILNRAPIVIL